MREGFGGKIGGKERGNNREWRGGNTCVERKWGRKEGKEESVCIRREEKG